MKIQVILCLAFVVAVQSGRLRRQSFDGNEEEEPCECVPYYQCDENRRIIIGGEGLLDPRIPVCAEAIDVCCRPPSVEQNITSPVPPGTDEPGPTEEPLPPFPTESPDVPPPDAEYPNVPEPQLPGGSGCGLRRITQPVNFGQDNDFRITAPDGSPTTTGFGEFPWTVAIFRNIRGSNNFICAGSLIHPSVILTAAHCIASTELGSLKVRAGDWDTQWKNEPIPHQDRGVIRVIPHPNFNMKNLQNDIALVVLESPFEITASVDIICVPETNDNNIDISNCLATGWGKNAFGKEGKYQTVMRSVQLPIVPNDECQERLRTTRVGHYFKLHESFMCAGGEPGHDTCTGDGGGPLICPTFSNRYTQVGIVSWGIGCGNSTPAVYSSVQYFSSWIQDHISAL